MAYGTVRVLVVEDSEPWRRQVCSILQCRPQFRVVAEVADGVAAVQKATELHPELILLDIGLPKLNGIEAAKMIRGRCPESRILFVTQEGDDEIRRAAMQLGAAGYVLKANAGNELLGAIAEAMLTTVS